jgi:hypothetical protein
MEIIDRSVIFLFFLALAGGAVFFPCFLTIWIKGLRKKKIGKKLIIPTVLGGVLFISPIILTFYLASIIENHGRDEVLSFIGNDDSYRVIIDGQKTVDPGPYITELRKITNLAAHHSHPNRRINIEIIKSDKKLLLILGQDSQYKNEFWVFYPKYRHTSLNEIGRVRTNLFDNH